MARSETALPMGQTHIDPIYDRQKSQIARGPVPVGHMHLGVVRGVIATIRDLGGDPDEIVQAAGLDMSLFASSTNTIALKEVGQLLETCRKRLDCPHIGLLVGARANLTSLALVGDYMRSCSSVGEALQGFEDHLWVQNRGAICSIRRSKDLLLVIFTPYDPDMSGVEMVAEGGLSTTVSAIRDMLDQSWTPLEVLLPRRLPRDPSPYTSFFKAPVRFDQEFAAVVLPMRVLSLPTRTADAVAKRHFLDCFENLKEQGHKIMLDDIRRAMRTRLLSGGCNATDIARHFGVNRRTLNRHLRSVGSSFQTVYNGVRFQAARHLIGDTDLPLAQISDVLHFSEPSAFTRAFQRWSGGVSPRDWRSRRTVAEGNRRSNGRKSG